MGKLHFSHPTYKGILGIQNLFAPGIKYKILGTETVSAFMYL